MIFIAIYEAEFSSPACRSLGVAFLTPALEGGISVVLGFVVVAPVGLLNLPRGIDLCFLDLGLGIQA